MKKPFNIEIHRKCCHTGCKNFAVFQIVGRLWAKGFSKKKASPAEVETSLAVCGDHKDEFNADTLYSHPDAQAMITQGFKSVGKAAPDFSTAEIYLKPIVRGQEDG